MSDGFVDVPGGRVWYESHGESGGVPLLLLHGGPGFAHYSFEPVLGFADDRPLIWYDQLGSGESDRPSDPSLWTQERFVEELAAVRSALGLDRVHILGHSWGTMLLADYLATKPDGVASATFSSPCLNAARWTADAGRLIQELPDQPREVLERSERGDAVSAEDFAAAMDVYYQRHVCRLEPWPAPVLRDFDAVNLEVYEQMWGPAEFRATGILKDYDAVPGLPMLELPTLFTCGRLDEATPESTASYAELVPGSKTHVFENSGHLSYVEEPDEYLRVIGAFLKENDR
jgi:proline iminopeptidase